MNELKIGDYVKIVSSGQSYSSYGEKFNELGFDNIEYNPSPKRGSIGKIFAIGFHNNGSTVYGVNVFPFGKNHGDYQHQSLMAFAGIEKIMSPVDIEQLIKEATIPVTFENVEIGLKIIRGKDWVYDDQDSYHGNTGTIISLPREGYTKGIMWVDVQWDNSSIMNSYRVGSKNDILYPTDLYYHPDSYSEVNTQEYYSNYKVGDKVKKVKIGVILIKTNLDSMVKLKGLKKIGPW